MVLWVVDYFPHGLIKIVNNLSLFLQNSFKSIKYGENIIQINDDMMVLAPKKRPWNHLLVLDLKMHCKVIDNINEPYCKPSFIRDNFILRLTVINWFA